MPEEATLRPRALHSLLRVNFQLIMFLSLGKRGGVMYRGWRTFAGYALVCALSLAIGYFVGREHLKYQLRTAFESAAEELKKGFAGLSKPPSTTVMSTAVATNTQPTQAPPAASSPEPPALSITLTTKRYHPSDPQSRDFEELNRDHAFHSEPNRKGYPGFRWCSYFHRSAGQRHQSFASRDQRPDTSRGVHLLGRQHALQSVHGSGSRAELVPENRTGG